MTTAFYCDDSGAKCLPAQLCEAVCSACGGLTSSAVLMGLTAAVPLLAGALVPAAMTAFGTVVPGLGTLHKAGGVAAVLQKIAAAGGTSAVAKVGGLSAALSICQCSA